MKIFKLFILFFLMVPFRGSSQGFIKVENPVNIKRPSEIVSVPWENILAVYPTIDTAYFIVINPVTGKQVAYQLEHLGQPAIQNLLIDISINAKAKLVLQIKKGKPEKFVSRTYCRYVPERDDDFAWENDKIAFRAYGKALEKTNGNAYGMDVWVKRTDKLVINERYKRGDYHKDHGDGMDYYHVGFSLGAGDIAPYVGDSVCYPKNYRNWKILDNGPLRSAFQLEYDEWNVGSGIVKVVKTLSIDAGSQLHKVEADYSLNKLSSLPVVVGIIKRPQAGKEFFDEQDGIMGYWEPTDPKDGTTGVGCIFTQPVKNVIIGKGQMLTLMDAQSDKPVVYYRGAAWDKAGYIKSAKDWFSHLEWFQQKIKNPLIVTVQKSTNKK